MKDFRIEEFEGKYYIYGTMESGNCICLGVYDSKKNAEKYLNELNGNMEAKMAA